MSNRPKRVSIISRESDERTLDVAMLEAELKSRGIEVTVLSKLLTKEKSIKALGYVGHVLRQEAAILSSDVVVLDTYCIPASMIPHRNGTKVVQIWHALSAIKKFGWQTIGKEGGSSEKVAKLMRMHHGYDYVACASDITAKHFCEAFRVEPGKIVKHGLPRVDYIKSVALGERQADMLSKIYAKYPQLQNEKLTVLYAPTFRRGTKVDPGELAAALDPSKYDLVVKLHPLYRGATGTEIAGSQAGAHVIYDDDFSSFDWLAAADIIISDYSSLVVESTLADKPLYIYAYDLDDYETNTGLNVDFENEPIAPYVFRDAKSLVAAIDKECGKDIDDANAYDIKALRAFKDRYIDIDTDDCTAALADFIESL